MAQGLIRLVSLCVVMAAASFLAGVLPLVLNLSSSRLRLVSTIGMGVLVGTSLIVIIPEGVDTLYSTGSAHAHRRRDISMHKAAVEWSHSSHLPSLVAYERRYEPALNELGTPGPVIPESESFPPPKTPTEPGVVGILEETGSADKHSDEGEEHEEAHHAWIGVALIAGFILMFLIDKLPQYTATNKPRTHTRHISLTNLGRRFNLTTLDREEEADTFLDTTQPTTEPSNRSFATTTGLVIHAAADGIALGASSSTSNTGLSFIIFFAIMVHKAPAAFGLTSVLLKQGLSKRMARAHLVIFSLAAPAGAFLTYLLANVLGGGSVSRSAESSQWWTGILLLFSAGTFLYVAMHSMQEITSPKHTETQMNGAANGSIHEGREAATQEEKPSITDLGAAVFGMILPLFLQVGHAH
ncbi:hypothetical protein PMZ80_000395 [Knufia obscura]|uniref:Zinc/iron permease n=1 Tax=Knufia obscura TaxID=1635080 RepID=A0ABR0S153_9EURO|nr:hypothetical protein PMZ80_000395 [Knufia obscura]